jgi:Flp pilus assembly pilin Flp
VINKTREKKMKFFQQLVGDERGLATAEYAVATVAACGFGGVLLKILGSATVTELLTDLIRKALGLVM